MSFWKNCKKYTWLAGVILGLLFLTIGASEGQLAVIWQKASLICMECIGIG